jgi:hypothetical protein
MKAGKIRTAIGSRDSGSGETCKKIDLLFGSFVIFGVGNSWGCCVVETAVRVVGVGFGDSCYLGSVDIAVDF